MDHRLNFQSLSINGQDMILMQPYEVQAYGLLGTFNTWYTSHNISAIIKRKEEEWATDGFLGNRDGADSP